MENKQVLIKAVLAGNAGVGKSAILRRASENAFTDQFYPTIGVDFKVFTTPDERYKFQLWDTAGQERFRTLSMSYYRGASMIILVYDIGDKQSLMEVNRFFEEARQQANPSAQYLLIGNKTDLAVRQVSAAEGQEYASKNDMFFLEASAKMDDMNIFRSKFIEVADKFSLAAAQN